MSMIKAEEGVINTVVVCILTYKRPELLRKSLRSVLRQNLKNETRIRIIVIDNDKAETGRIAVESFENDKHISVQYVVEPRKGLANARNKALTESGQCNYVIFLDDDEEAGPEWIERLLATQSQTNADVVCGPVIPEFEVEKEWARNGGFYLPRNLANLSVIRYAETNNVLMAQAIACRYRFDEKFNHTGGEDTHFFEEIYINGGRFNWARNAWVKEAVPESRLKCSWIIRRSFSSANRFTRAMLRLHHGPTVILVRLLKGLAGLICGFGMLPLSLIGKTYAIKSACYIARGLGTISGLIGYAQKYY